jgi:hypothetical protein
MFNVNMYAADRPVNLLLQLAAVTFRFQFQVKHNCPAEYLSAASSGFFLHDYQGVAAVCLMQHLTVYCTYRMADWHACCLTRRHLFC